MGRADHGRRREFEQASFERRATVRKPSRQFEASDTSLLQQIQHFLHSNPAAVPLIVLVLSVADLRRCARRRSSSRPFTLTLILQQVAIVGIVGARRRWSS